tara:strand:+ start:562 stop:765 length:204 start_codon:yes stop_codon:yes gene_type:complete
MKFGKILAVASAATLAVAPIAAQADVRTAAPVNGESEVGGGAGFLVLFALLAVGIGIVVTDEEPASP